VICNLCVTELDQAYQFKEKSSKTESLLLSILDEVVVKDEPKSPSLVEIETIKIEEDCELEVAALQVLEDMKLPPKPTFLEMDQKLNLKFSCLLCHRELATIKYLNRHVLRHLKGNLKPSLKDQLLAKHYNISVPVDKQFACKTPHQSAPLNYHHRIVCPFCGMMFSTQSMYDKHYGIYHLPEKLEKTEEPVIELFTCHYDGRKFIKKEHLRKHMNAYHRPTKGTKAIFKCRKLDCKKSCVSKEELVQHRREHCDQADQESKKCKICSKSFKKHRYLSNHMIHMHSSSKDYLCNECGKAFASKSSLKEHLIRHLPNKQFSCDTCGRAFPTKGSLTKHKDSHTGLQPYQCDYPGCSAKFTRAYVLNQHLLVQ
jgi:Zinc finger, C2H2 type